MRPEKQFLQDMIWFVRELMKAQRGEGDYRG